MRPSRLKDTELVEMRSALHAFARSMIELFIVLESAGSNCWRYRHHESAVKLSPEGPGTRFGRDDAEITASHILVNEQWSLVKI